MNARLLSDQVTTPRPLGRPAVYGFSQHDHPLYPSWAAMHARCRNPNVSNHGDYGGRGIKVCDRWTGPGGFVNFVADMGSRPEGHSLDRINNDGNYEPGNCRWATREEQRANRRPRTMCRAGLHPWVSRNLRERPNRSPVCRVCEQAYEASRGKR